MTGKRDSFGRSEGQIYGENGSSAPVAMVSVPYSFGRSGEMPGKCDSFGRSAEKIYGESGLKGVRRGFLRPRGYFCG